MSDETTARPSGPRRGRLTGPDYPTTKREIEHRAPMLGTDARAIFRTIREALMREHGVSAGESPFAFEPTDPGVEIARGVTFHAAGGPDLPVVTLRHRVCALVDDLAELEAEVVDGAEVVLVVRVRQ